MDYLDVIKKYYDIVDSSTTIDKDIFKVNHDAVSQIVDLFADNGVYNRQGSELKVGKDRIKEFFAKERSLVGHHTIDNIEIKEGAIVGKKVGGENCKTVKVKGKFSGEFCMTKEEGSKRKVSNKLKAELEFDDYWVFSGDKVAYRQSDIFVARKKVNSLPSNTSENVRY